MKRSMAALALMVVGCGSNDLTLHYKLDGIAPADVVRVETRVTVAPSDPRAFYADQPFRQVATGIGYEVRDVDGTGHRTLLVTHDATLGYVFASTFDFRLLPPIGGSAPPLSISARAVGATDMIGTTMELAGHFGENAKLAVDIADQRCGTQACDANMGCCGGACTPVQSDPANCGGCGTACGSTGDSCSGATCRCAGGSACAGGTTCCASVGCIDLQSDPFHCGACDHACNPGEACVGGVCKCGTSGACAASTACCSDGSCATAQGCPCGGVFCAFPTVCCNNTCVDPRSNNADCGSCGHACTAPLACANGACACKGAICGASDTCCASGCANTANDPNNCGACGKKCLANEVCSGGQCLCGSVACADGQLCCGGSCVNQTALNCGACNHVCKLGESCAGGACGCNGGAACTGNQVCCPASTTGGGGCADLSSDPSHCGDCGNACPPGNACVLGKCVQSACNPPCANGNSCVNGQCRCNGSGACGNGTTCCSDGCKDLTSDPNNCNACGKMCSAGSYCCKGVCTPPDDKNCTGCGQGCGTLSSCCACPGQTPRCTTLVCSCPAG